MGREIEVDQADNSTNHHSGTRFNSSALAPVRCWNGHQAFENPGRIFGQLAETPDGVRYSAFPRMFRAAVANTMCWHSAVRFPAQTVSTVSNSTAISWRICERTQCASRAVPPLKGRLVMEHNKGRAIPAQSAQRAKNCRPSCFPNICFELPRREKTIRAWISAVSQSFVPLKRTALIKAQEPDDGSKRARAAFVRGA